MLSLQLNDGEYLTIGKDIVIQVFANSTVKVSVQAPRDMNILRGEVLERNGEERPACLHGQPPAKEKSGSQSRPEQKPGAAGFVRRGEAVK